MSHMFREHTQSLIHCWARLNISSHGKQNGTRAQTTAVNEMNESLSPDAEKVAYFEKGLQLASEVFPFK